MRGHKTGRRSAEGACVIINLSAERVSSRDRQSSAQKTGVEDWPGRLRLESGHYPGGSLGGRL